jgi:hypothetical protein
VSTQSQTSDLPQEASKTSAAAALKITFFILNSFLLSAKETKLFYFSAIFFKKIIENPC